MIDYKNKWNIITTIVIIILTIFMFYYETKKEGFHEDEIFSYGSSNYAFDNVYQPYGNMDIVNQVLIKYVLKDNWISNIVYYMGNTDKFFEAYNKEWECTSPVWKTKEDAKNYLTVSQNDILNYISVIYNQSRDVHPPLFYILVHFVSSIFLGTFSKYIVFTINIIFFILTCIVTCKIFKLYKKEKLAICTLILYGLSIGAISTVMFQRMYMMLTFWTILYLYTAIKISRNGLNKENIRNLQITTILGFLTQYYFCIFVLAVFLVLLIHLKEKKKWIKNNIKFAIIRIINISSKYISYIFFI